MTTTATVWKADRREKMLAEKLKGAEEREQERPTTYRCLKCKDKKFFVWTDANGYEYAEPCECQKKDWTDRAQKHREKIAREKEMRRKRAQAAKTAQDHIPEGFEQLTGDIPF